MAPWSEATSAAKLFTDSTEVSPVTIEREGRTWEVFSLVEHTGPAGYIAMSREECGNIRWTGMFRREKRAVIISTWRAVILWALERYVAFWELVTTELAAELGSGHFALEGIVYRLESIRGPGKPAELFDRHFA
jgi:hypothetical protein